MGVAYSSPDFFPQTCVLYVCRCGRRATEHGRHTDESPPGWVHRDDEDVVCPTCAEACAEERAPARA